MRDSENAVDGYRWCEQLCRRSKSSFYYSFKLLDRPRRRAMCALYAFARITDDLVDSSDSLEWRSSQLEQWSQLLHAYCDDPQVDLPTARYLQDVCALSDVAVDGKDLALSDSLIGRSVDLELLPLWPALADCVQRYQIPLQLLDDIITGVAMDLKPETPRTWDEVYGYCYHVASAVGLACAYIWRSGDNLPRQSAIDCGIAFQLTNILRDVAEDARMGRIYLPYSEFETYGVDRVCWLSGQPDGRWEELIEHVAAEARQRYSAGWQTIHALTPPSQRMFSLMWRSYRALLEQVVVEKQSLWGGGRVRLSRGRRWRLFTSHLIPPIFARLPAP